jgi:hypothetical protein
VEETLDTRALNRATLARQMLLRRADVPVTAAVERLVGLQSQSPTAAYVGLWSRVEGFDPAELSQLLLDRRVVRSSLQRGTVHLVTAEDCLMLRPLLQPVYDRFVTGRGPYARAVARVDVDELTEVSRALLQERPRTHAELRAALAKHWPEPDHDPASLATAVRVFVPLVQVPPRGLWGRGGQATHTPVEAWLGHPHPLPLAADPSPAGLDDMVLRYLAGFGPATVKDAQVWSGLTRLGEVVERLRPRLRSFRDEQGRELLDLPDAPRPDPETPAPVRFLPEYDNLLRSHEDRSRVLVDGHRRHLASANDSPKPTFLVDGVVAGGWKLATTRRRATLRVDPFRPLTGDEEAAVTAEAERLLAFAAADVDPGHRELAVADPPAA